MRARFAAALQGWATSGVGPPGLLTLLIFAMTSYACRDASSDCSWGFELLAVVPVLLVCWFVTGPLRVGTLVGRAEPGMRRRATIVTLLASPFALWFVLAVLVRGVLPMFGALVVVTFAVPAVVAVLTARRGAGSVSADEAGDVAGR